MSPAMKVINNVFPGFDSTHLSKEQQFRVLFNAVSLKEIDREDAVNACVELAQPTSSPEETP